MRSKPSRNESKWIASSASLDWIHICCAVAVRGKWRMQMAELSKAIKETCRARRRPPKRDLKSFSSFMTRSRLRHNKPIYGNMHTLYMARYTIHIYIWGIFTSGNTRFNHIGKLVSKSLFDLPLKKMGPLWVHNRESGVERGGNSS